MYSFIVSFHIYKYSKHFVKIGKFPSLLLNKSNIKKQLLIVSIFGTSHIFTIFHIFTHFSTDTICVNKREVTVYTLKKGKLEFINLLLFSFQFFFVHLVFISSLSTKNKSNFWSAYFFMHIFNIDFLKQTRTILFITNDQ